MSINRYNFLRSARAKSNKNLQALFEFAQLVSNEICIDKFFEIFITREPAEELSLHDLSEALLEFGLASFVAKLSLDELAFENIPFLAVVRLGHLNGRKKEFIETSFVCVRSIGPDEILCRSFGGIDYTLSRQEFELGWTELCLLAEPSFPEGNKTHGSLVKEASTRDLFSSSARLVGSIIGDDLRLEICDLIASGQIGFARSKVKSRDNVSSARTSKTGYLPNDIEKKIFAYVAQQAEFRNCKLERPQVTMYEEGQEFRGHFDVSQDIYRPNTCIIMLSADFEGGETVFPILNKSFSLRNADGLIFSNVSCKSDLYTHSFHFGKVVTRGRKIILNVWSKADLFPEISSGTRADFFEHIHSNKPDIGLVCKADCRPCEKTLQSLQDLLALGKIANASIITYYPSYSALTAATDMGLKIDCFPTFFKFGARGWSTHAALPERLTDGVVDNFAEWVSAG